MLARSQLRPTRFVDAGRSASDSAGSHSLAGRDRPRREAATAVRADVEKPRLNAVGAEGALVAADARLRRVRREGPCRRTRSWASVPAPRHPPCWGAAGTPLDLAHPPPYQSGRADAPIVCSRPNASAVAAAIRGLGASPRAAICRWRARPSICCHSRATCQRRIGSPRYFAFRLAYSTQQEIGG